jgi:Flp pilus assembly protein TadD
MKNARPAHHVKAKKTLPLFENSLNDCSLSKIPSSTRFFLLLTTLILSVFFAYSNIFNNPFVFDDPIVIEKISNGSFFNLVFHNTRRPLLMLSLFLNFIWTGNVTWSYHLVNIFIHLVATSTLFLLVREVFNLNKIASFSSEKSDYLAFAVALLWGLHPLNTESVTYIVQRCEALMGMFYLLSLLFLVYAYSSNKRYSIFYFLSFAMFVAGLASKEAMVSYLVVVLMFDITFLTRSFTKSISRNRTIYILLTIFLTSAILFGELGKLLRAAFFDYGITSFEYFVNQSAVLFQYLKLSFYPVHLCFDYAWPISGFWDNFPFLVLLLIVFVVSCILFLRQYSLLSFLSLWFFINLAPRSSFAPRPDLAVEHRMYIPLIAIVCLFVMLAIYINKLFLKYSIHTKVFGRICFLIIAILLGGLTFQRNKVYKTNLRLWENTLKIAPKNPRAYNYLGIEYHNRGQDAIAEKCFKKSLCIIPGYDLACNNLANLYAIRGRLNKAIELYEKSLETKPHSLETLSNISKTLVKVGRLNDALKYISKALKLQPDNKKINWEASKIFILMGKEKDAAKCMNTASYSLKDKTLLMKKMADYLLIHGKLNSALKKYLLIKQHFSHDHLLSYRIATIYLKKNELTNAEKYFKICQKLKSDFPPVYNDLGIVAKKKGNIVSAKQLFMKAISLNKNYAAAYFNLGLLYYQNKEFEYALQNFKKCRQILPNNKQIERLYKSTLIFTKNSVHLNKP